VDNSLVIVELLGGQTRHRLLETVRQYGQAKLRAADEDSTVRRRHRDWYLDLAERADAGLRGPEEETWLGRLEIEHDNLRAAIEWTKAQPDGDDAVVRFAAVLEWFWYLLGHWTEGRARLEEAIARVTEATERYLPKVLVGSVRLAYRQGDVGRAKDLCARGLALSRLSADQPGTAQFLIWTGIIAIAEGRPDDAVRPVEEALVVCRRIGDLWWAVEALTILGTVATMRGEYGRAGGYHAESLALSRETGNLNNTTYALRSLGVLAVRRGDAARALAHYAECLELCRGIRTPGVIAECLEGTARALEIQKRHERATVLFGAVDALFQTLRGRLPLWADESEHERYVAAARAGLHATAFGAAWERGRGMSVELALEYALASREAEPGGRPGAVALTARELEVAALIAQGLTNREIGTTLVITERTAETHVQNILNKLGFASRAQIAAWAVEQGLQIRVKP
jgi:non-specific serine/threonine protein kinase